MSGALLGLSAAGGIATQAVSASGVLGMLPEPLAAFIRSPRSIGTIIPDVTIEESHSDRMTVTQHPIADGSPISDHVYKLPATVVMRVGFTNANPIGAITQGFMAGGGFSDIGGGLAGAGSGLLSSFTEMRVKEVYKKLLDLQFNRDAWEQLHRPVVPFDLTTGKRKYKNMVITELSIRTDRTTEYSLVVECHMQEVWLVKTQSTTQPSQANQADPKKTASPTDQQQKSPTEVAPDPNSHLKQDFGVILK
jgi:Dit-like phage tail protein